MRKGILGYAALSLLVSAAQAGQNNIIVSYKDTKSVRSGNALGLNVKKVLVEDRNIILLEPAFQIMDSNALLQMLREDSNVNWAQLDHEVSLRSDQSTNEVTPDDTDFSKQWSLKSTEAADIRATVAWNLGQGGKTIAGDDIVVAVVDQGVDATHNSLKENIWVNTDEIPGNKIDDDNNGYVDDVNGWDAVIDQGKIAAETHATHVAGIIGARGNDASQIAGVNWTTKILSVRVLGYGDKSLTSTILDGYGYVIKQKKEWLATGGAQGANVVATNSSFGVDYAKCASGEYPAWNEIYNAMGEVGILSAAATANIGIDVDVRGDVPTTCESEFIVSVTNTMADGKKSNNAAWGLKHIDLGAPGTAILSTVPGQGLKSLSGTSMATPHVAGAIGFLHSVASNDFIALYKENPAQAALALKKMMLESVTPQADLSGKTVTGGRLNLATSGQLVSQFTK